MPCSRFLFSLLALCSQQHHSQSSRISQPRDLYLLSCEGPTAIYVPFDIPGQYHRLTYKQQHRDAAQHIRAATGALSSSSSSCSPACLYSPNDALSAPSDITTAAAAGQQLWKSVSAIASSRGKWFIRAQFWGLHDRSYRSNGSTYGEDGHGRGTRVHGAKCRHSHPWLENQLMQLRSIDTFLFQRSSIISMSRIPTSFPNYSSFSSRGDISHGQGSKREWLLPRQRGRMVKLLSNMLRYFSLREMTSTPLTCISQSWHWLPISFSRQSSPA